MLDHHLQLSILYRLAFNPSLRFSELKPDDVENKLFDYHLKKVLHAGLVMKTATGEYTLTPEGKRLGMRMFDKQQAVADQAESVLFLIIRRASDGAWLFYRRSTFPMLGYTGFMHANPNADEPCSDTARNACLEKTGLDGAFTALGGGYFRIFNTNEQLESFTHFTLLYCNDVLGELTEHDELADYYWLPKPDFSAPDFFPSTSLLHKHYEIGTAFFIEQTFIINA